MAYRHLVTDQELDEWLRAWMTRGGWDERPEHGVYVGITVNGPTSADNAAYFAAFSPEVGLALCDAAERGLEAEAERDELRATLAALPREERTASLAVPVLTTAPTEPGFYLQWVLGYSLRYEIVEVRRMDDGSSRFDSPHYHVSLYRWQRLDWPPPEPAAPADDDPNEKE